MKIKNRIRQLKQKLDDSRERPGKYTNPPRKEIIDFLFSGSHENWSITDLSEALGLSVPTIYKWRKKVMDERESIFLPVVSKYSPVSVGTITFESAHGHQLHGLSVDDAIHVLQALS